MKVRYIIALNFSLHEKSFWSSSWKNDKIFSNFNGKTKRTFNEYGCIQNMKNSILVIYENIVMVIGRLLKLGMFEDIAIRKRTGHVAASFYIVFSW